MFRLRRSLNILDLSSLRRGYVADFNERKDIMIAILKMKAYGDFDEPYDINIAAGNRDKVLGVCGILISFCELLPGCSQDVKLAKYLNDEEYVDRLMGMLIMLSCFSTQQAKMFIEKLRSLCDGPSVYVYKDTFSVDEIEQI